MFWVFNIQLNCFISIMDFCWSLLLPKYDDMSMIIDFFYVLKNIIFIIIIIIITIFMSSLSSSSSSQFSYHYYHRHLHYYHSHHHHNFHFHTTLRWIHVEKENCLHFHDITVCHNCLFITWYHCLSQLSLHYMISLFVTTVSSLQYMYMFITIKRWNT